MLMAGYAGPISMLIPGVKVCFGLGQRKAGLRLHLWLAQTLKVPLLQFGRGFAEGAGTGRERRHLLVGTRNNCSVWKQRWSVTKGEALALAWSTKLHPGWLQCSASDGALVVGSSGAPTVAVTTVLNSWGRTRLACFSALWREGVRQLLPGMGALGNGVAGLRDKELGPRDM